MRLTGPVTLALALLALFAGTAKAHHPGAPLARSAGAQDWPAQRPATDPLLHDLLAWGTDWWRAHGRELPCTPALDIAQLPTNYGGMAYTTEGQGDCRVILSEIHQAVRMDAHARMPRWSGTVRWRAGTGRWRWRVVLSRTTATCKTMLHELGHVSGLAQQTWDPVTQAWVDGHPLEPSVMSNANPVTPPECVAWANARYPKPPRRPR